MVIEQPLSKQTVCLDFPSSNLQVVPATKSESV
jgi:hypothetical protein